MPAQAGTHASHRGVQRWGALYGVPGA